MNRSNKKGITLASLVIYMMLFTVVTVFVSAVSSNMNERLFTDRGEAINYTNLNKLQYNIENSSLESKDVVVTKRSISFSNGDNYEYDEEAKAIYKNNGVLCSNVESFSAIIESSTNAKKIILDVSFNRYLNILEKQIVTCVEGV